MQQTKEFTASGYVTGILWSGGPGYMPAKTQKAKTLADLYGMVNDGIKSGELGTGDFEFLTGAVTTIYTKTTIYIKGKEFTNTTFRIESFGKVPNKTKKLIIMELFS